MVKWRLIWYFGNSPVPEHSGAIRLATETHTPHYTPRHYVHLLSLCTHRAYWTVGNVFRAAYRQSYCTSTTTKPSGNPEQFTRAPHNTTPRRLAGWRESHRFVTLIRNCSTLERQTLSTQNINRMSMCTYFEEMTAQIRWFLINFLSKFPCHLILM